MHIGFEITAAKPKKADPTEQPAKESMRGRRTITATPSTDQKAQRRRISRSDSDRARKGSPHQASRQHHPHHLATQFDSTAEHLNPGDTIRGQNGQLVQVQQVQLHPTDQSRVYIQTDQGAIEANRTDPWTVVRGPNALQQEVPTSPGQFGGNTNTLPGGNVFDRAREQQERDNPGQGATPNTCPVCGTTMTVRNSATGPVHVCPRDGYTQQGAGIGGTADPAQMWTHAPKGQSARPYGPGSLGSMATTAARDGTPAHDEPDHECRLCGGELRHAGKNAAHCRDCGSMHHYRVARYTTPTTPLSAIAQRAKTVLTQTDAHHQGETL